MEEVRFLFCPLHFGLRYPEAFSLHRDPEAHIPSEEQGRQQRQTGKIPIWIFCDFRSGACHATGLLQQTGKADQVLVVLLPHS